MADVSTRDDEEDPGIGSVAVLFAVGFLTALAYLRATYPTPGLGQLTPAAALWAALFCTQVAAWLVVTVLSVKSIRDLHRREPLNGVVPFGRIAVVVIVLAATCYAIFITFLESPAVVGILEGVKPAHGIKPTIAGLDVLVAGLSYIPLMVVGGSLLIAHAALKRLVDRTQSIQRQVSRLRDLGNRLRMLLFGATILVGLSSASAVTLNFARRGALAEGPLASEYFWIHGGLYSVLLALLYIPAHVTLVRKGRVVAEQLFPLGSPGGEPGAPVEGRKQIADEMGIHLSGIPGWEVVVSILVPLATSLLG